MGLLKNLGKIGRRDSLQEMAQYNNELNIISYHNYSFDLDLLFGNNTNIKFFKIPKEVYNK
ncbi:hypothetical protein [Clostridium sp.]|uniref:hypothetical protein n=1 Tax=Clostridium sp. TaxID=1506 RepID=UPI003F2EBC06